MITCIQELRFQEIGLAISPLALAEHLKIPSSGLPEIKLLASDRSKNYTHILHFLSPLGTRSISSENSTLLHNISKMEEISLGLNPTEFRRLKYILKCFSEWRMRSELEAGKSWESSSWCKAHLVPREAQRAVLQQTLFSCH